MSGRPMPADPALRAPDRPRRPRRRPAPVAHPEPIYSRLGAELGPRSLGKYQAVLNAATAMFIAQGFGATSMDAIAEAAGVSKRTVYGHFETKQSLFAAVIQSLCARVVPASLDELQAATAPVEQVLHELGRRFLLGIYTAEQLALFRTVINDARRFPEVGIYMFDGPVRRSEAVMADYLRLQADAGRLHLPAPELAASQFLGMLKTNLHVELLMKPELEPPTPEQVEAITAACVALFLHGAAKGG